MRHTLKTTFSTDYNHTEVLEALALSIILRQLQIDTIVLDGNKYHLSKFRDTYKRSMKE